MEQRKSFDNAYALKIWDYQAIPNKKTIKLSISFHTCYSCRYCIKTIYSMDDVVKLNSHPIISLLSFYPPISYFSLFVLAQRWFFVREMISSFFTSFINSINSFITSDFLLCDKYLMLPSCTRAAFNPFCNPRCVVQCILTHSGGVWIRDLTLISIFRY